MKTITTIILTAITFCCISCAEVKNYQPTPADPIADRHENYNGVYSRYGQSSGRK